MAPIATETGRHSRKEHENAPVFSLRTIKRGAVLAFIIQSAGAGIAFLLQVFLARVAGSSSYGDYVFIVSIATLVAVPVGCGFPISAVRFIPEYTGSESGLLTGVLHTAYRAVLVLGACVFVITLLGTALLFETSSYKIAMGVLFGGLLVVLRAFLDLQCGIGRGFGSIVLAFGPDKILRPILIAIFVGALLFTSDGLEDAGYKMVGAAVGAAFVSALVQRVGLRSRKRTLAGSIANYRTKYWLVQSLPFVAITGFQILIARTDVILLGVLSDSSSVGIYNAASRIAILVGFVLAAVNAIFAPAIASHYARGETKQLERVTRSATRLIFWPSLAIALFLLAFSEPLLHLFGLEFVAARTALIVLIAGQLVNAGVGPVGYLLNMTGRQRLSMRVIVVCAVINVALNAVAIPLYGLVGAAVATTSSIALWNLWMLRIVRRELGIRSSVIDGLRGGRA